MSNHGLFATQRSRAARLEQRGLSPQAGSVSTPPQLTASVNDYCPVGWDSCDVLRLSSSGSVNITGFRRALDGRPRLVWNVGSNPIVLINGSSSSVVGNRIAAVSDVTLIANSTSVIQYDVASNAWRVMGQELAGTGTSGQVLTSNGPGTLPTFQAGGVTGFTSSQNTSSPNNTVNASRLLVSASSTNADIVLSPKGTGAILAQLPDSTATGGNKRGAGAVDFQTKRSNANQVAEGNYSVICAGRYNRNSATRGGIVAGNGNSIFGAHSFIGAGVTNYSSSGNTVICGGMQNTANGTYAAVLGGSYNKADGSMSSVPGGYRATVRSLYGMAAIASGRFGTNGDAQRGQYILRCLTTNATQTTLTADQGAASTTNQVVLPNNSGYTIRGMAHSHRTDSIGTSVSWTFMANIRRGANAASTTLVGSSMTEVAKDSGGLTWLLDLSADTTNGGLAIKFTGEASKTIRTVCVVESCEVTS